MTVETTSFLSGAKITTNGSEKSAKILKNHKNCIIFLFAIILLLFCVSASILQIWIMNRMSGMQDDIQSNFEQIDQQRFKIDQQKIEIDQLEEEVSELREIMTEMRKNIGFDDELFDDLDEFDKKYPQEENKDEIDLDENLSIDDGKIKFDDVGEEDEDDDDNYENSHSGSGYGENYDDDDEYDIDPLENSLASAKKEDDNNIYKDMIKTRKARSITGVTDQGVPIIEEPYAMRRNRSRTDNPGTNVIASNTKSPKLQLTWDNSRRHWSTPRREQLDRNVNRIHHTRHHHSLQDSKNRFAFAAAPVHHSFESFGKKLDEAPSSPSSVQTRRSRVMHVEDKTKAFRQVVRKDQLDRLQEVRKAPEQWTNQQNANARRRAMLPIRRNPELKNGKRMKITAVHYEGDASSLAVGHHQNQGEEEGNNKIKLNKNEYIHWAPAGWLNSHGMDKFFTMDHTGVLTVKDHGVFLIYAQVVYSNDHDGNGFRIELNDRIQYQCLTMSHATTHVTRTNSCYTSGLIHLKHGDKIQIKDIGNHRSVMLEPSKSFFGLVKINLLPATESSEVETFNA